jgi:WD40 repeat protein
MLATAGGGELARLWDTEAGTLIRAVTVSPARDIAFSPDSYLLASTGRDKTTRLWDLKSTHPDHCLIDGEGPFH